MKTRFLIVIILSVMVLQTIKSQTIPSIQLNIQPGQTYTQAIAASMQQLNNDRIPYGVLYERVVEWTDLIRWQNGNTTEIEHVEQAWWDLENSKLPPTNTPTGASLTKCNLCPK